MQTVILNIQGMHCGGCVRTVTRVLTETAGVQQAEVDLDAARATVVFDETRTDAAALADAVEEAGFDVQIAA